MANPIINILKTEWGYLGKRRKLFAFYISLFVIAGLVELVNPYILGSVFNSIQNVITSKEELNQLIFKIFLLFIVMVVFWIFHGFGRVLETTTSFFVKKNYINDKLRIIFKLPIKWHKDNHSGDTIDKVNRASGALDEFSGQVTYRITYAIINFFGSIIVLSLIDWQIGLFTLIYAMITLFIVSRLDKRLNAKYKELNKYSNDFSSAFFDYISNIITIITLRLRRTVSEELDHKQAVSYKTYKSSSIMNEVKWGFASIAIQFMVTVVLIYRAYTEFGATGTIMIGTLYMLFGYLRNVGETYYQFADLYGQIVRYNAKIEGAYPLDAEYAKLGEVETSNLPDNWNKIEMKNISFAYDKEGKITHIDDINFNFTKGQKIALVGESGSGKSTILSLIRGLYNPESGKIYCNGKLLPNGVSDIKDEVTLIPQEPEIFNNSFRYNITMNLNVNENDLNKSIELAQLKKVIDKLPKGLDTSVMEKGVSLSGGEKQRLALARGLLAARKSDIVLLDEPTSSVDSLNELKIHENIFREFKNKTIISSIHRLHLLDKFDYIYLFSKGKIVGQGTFEKLKNDAHFKTMWTKYNKEKREDTKLEKKEIIK
jgi:ABC-type multidrug transport system fused ATPase/permease subunit